ncbi:TVP38/TMEM64 family protein [Halorubellus salinus]|uniref:TVP38/TMEM64 family protein n=1 Tax=Halorubellus salinus TaxID=755309 RepID=UPI001D08A9BE|nr:TVP38/TMEM64 family protein [Halorubellus salinus]
MTMLGDERFFESDRARRRALVATVATVVAFAASAWVVHEYASVLLSPAWARETVREFGPWAPVAYTTLQAVQVVLAPVPGQTLGFLAGYLFGAIAGTTYSMVGVVAGSWIVFRLARAYGRSAVESWVTDDVLEGFDGFVDEQGEAALFVVFLLPAFPDDAICFLAGLSELRERRFLGLLVVGRFPSFAAVALAGDQFAREQVLPFVALATALVLVTVVGYLRRDLLERVDERAAAWRTTGT